MVFVKADTAQYSCKISGKTFQILNVDIQEEISNLFCFRLELWIDDPEVAIAPMLRQQAEIHIAWESKERKYYGIVAGMRQTEAGRIGEVDQEYGHYVVEIVPNLWLLTHKSNCRIFQNKTADEIIKIILSERCPSQEFSVKLVNTYEIREFCVQYRETDFAFISRLMEEEGIFYYFSHDGPEKMILGDSPSAYGKTTPETKVKYAKATGNLPSHEEYLERLSYEENVYSGKITFKDFDYFKPKNPLKTDHSGPKNADLELYDYHLERYSKESHGRNLATMAEEAQNALRTVLQASGNWRSVSSGCTFTLEKAFRSDLNKNWLIVSCSHSADLVSGTDYSVSLIAIPADTSFRAMPLTPQPSLGIQTAEVVGPKGQEIYMDKLGRAKVQFHWDLEGKKDETTTCWIRVAQQYAGMNEDTNKKHGFHWHPLIGDEVVVDFLEGDPDDPLITGSVYNGDKKPPIKPEEHIRNLILTRYQHQLLMDDKNKAINLNTPYRHTLHMDDPGQYFLLSTQYGSQIKMWDPHKDNQKIPKIMIQTGGSESLVFEDEDPELGNNIKMKTKDGHTLILSEGPEARGVHWTTVNENTVFLNDKDRNILIGTTDGHKVLLDDANQKILITSKQEHRIEINDGENFIEIADSSGNHRFKIDIDGPQLSISTDTGNIDLTAPNGEVRIEAQNVKIDSKTTVDVSCMDLKAKAKKNVKLEAGMNFEEKAGMKHKTGAMNIEEKASLSLKLESMSIESKASVMNKRKGVMVQSTASGINEIKGILVKIN